MIMAKKAKRRKKYGKFQKAANGLMLAMWRLGIAPSGMKADGDPGAKFDAGIENAKRAESHIVRAFLHALMYEAILANPDVQRVEMHTWSGAADDVVAMIKREAHADATRAL
jgi:hypothetical protein